MIFLIITVLYTVRFFQKEFVLSISNTILVWFFSLLPFLILLPEDPIGHTLMTESLTYPLVYLYFCSTVKGINGKKNGFVWGLVLAFTATLVRSQMMYLFVVSIVSYVYYCFLNLRSDFKHNISKKKTYSRACLRMLTLILVSFVIEKGTSWIHSAYDKAFFGAPTISYSDQTLVQHMLYLSDSEDENLFSSDIEVQEIFRETYSVIDSEKANYKYQEKGYNAWKKIVGDCGADSYALNDTIEDYYTKQGLWPDNTIEQEELKSDISHRMALPLLRVHWKDKIQEAFDLIPSSIVSTILFHKEEWYSVIYPVSFLLYIIAYISGFVMLRGTNRKRGKFIILSFTMSLINVAACNIVHFGLQRYLAYTLGLNWIGLYFVFLEIVNRLKTKKMR